MSGVGDSLDFIDALPSRVEASAEQHGEGHVDIHFVVFEHDLALVQDSSGDHYETSVVDTCNVSNAVEDRSAPARNLTLNSASNRAFFETSLVASADLQSVQLPWESEFAQQIFGNPSDILPSLPNVSIGAFSSARPVDVFEELIVSAQEAAESCKHMSIFPSVVKYIDDKSHAEQCDSLMDAAINKLLIILRHSLLASAVGRQILALGSEGQQSAGEFAIVSAVLGTKSPFTVIKRANSLLSFLRWFAKQGLDCANPFSEEHVWAYFQYLRAPATRAAACLSAFRFASHVLGFESLEEVIASRRILGLSEKLYSGKRLLRQALPLTVSQMQRLHGILQDENRNVIDRCAAAYFLIATYGRCGHSDLVNIHSIVPDHDIRGGFLEVKTSPHKTGRGAEKQTQLLPILIPAIGVTGEPWLLKASQIFLSCGISLDGHILGPLFPAPSNSSELLFGRRPLSSIEASSYSRALLGLPEPSGMSEEQIVSSHSCKVTTLSWAAKFGLSPMSRSILGRHTSATAETFSIYSRDLCVAPARELQEIIICIHRGSFFPDAPRSEFFPDRPLEVRTAESSGAKSLCESDRVVPCGRLVKVEHESIRSTVTDTSDVFLISDEETSISDSANDADSSASSCLEEPPVKVKRFRPRVPPSEKWFVHKKSHILHRVDGNSKFVACGKRLTDQYRASDESSAWNVLCKMCLKRRPED